MKLIALNDSFGQFKLLSFTKPRIIRSEIMKKRFHKMHSQWMTAAHRTISDLKEMNQAANKMLGRLNINPSCSGANSSPTTSSHTPNSSTSTAFIRTLYSTTTTHSRRNTTSPRLVARSRGCNRSSFIVAKCSFRSFEESSEKGRS